MKIAILGHSLVADRQQIFLEELSKYAEILVISPEIWGNHKAKYFMKLEKGKKMLFLIYPVQQDFLNYVFPDDAFDRIKEFDPDIIYSITEWTQAQAFRSINWAKEINKPLAMFSWENIGWPSLIEVDFMKNINLMICGNAEAQAIFDKYHIKTECIIFPGIDTELFKKNKKTAKEFDLVFVGRKVHQKGYADVMKLLKDFYINIPENVSYEKMPSVYNSAKIQIVPSYNTLRWKEQMPACISEGLACEIPTIAYNTGSMKSVYAGCDAVKLVPEGSLDMMKKAILNLLSHEEKLLDLGKIGRKYVENKYSLSVVAKQTVEALEKCLK